MGNRKNLIFARDKRNNWLYHKTAARPDRRGGGDSEISGFQQEREAGVDLFVGEEGAVTGLDDGGFRRKLQMPGLLQRGEGVGGGTAATLPRDCRSRTKRVTGLWYRAAAC